MKTVREEDWFHYTVTWEEMMERQGKGGGDRNGDKRRPVRSAAPFVVLALVLLLGGRWTWRQAQFSRLRVPLFKAVEEGDTVRVRDLLDQGADPDARQDDRPVTFTWNDMWERLRGRGSALLSEKPTALMRASERNGSAIVELLLAHGARVDLVDSSNSRWTALHYAASGTATDCVSMLLQHGGDVNAEDGDGATPLLRALSSSSGLEKDVLRETTCVQLLLAKGARVNAVTKTGLTPLMATSGQTFGKTRLLLSHGANVNARDDTDMTALMYAAVGRETNGVRDLLKAGADVNAQEWNGKTALQLAVESCYGLDNDPLKEQARELIQALLKGGGDLHLKDHKGKTAPQVAEELLPGSKIATMLRKAEK